MLLLLLLLLWLLPHFAAATLAINFNINLHFQPSNRGSNRRGQQWMALGSGINRDDLAGVSSRRATTRLELTQFLTWPINCGPLMQSSMAGRVHLMAMSDGLDFNIFTYYIKVEGSSD